MPDSRCPAPPATFRPAAWGIALLACVALTACAALNPPPPAPPPVVEAPVPPPPPPPPPAPPPPAPVAEPEPADAAARRLLFYSEQLRRIPPGELGGEIARLQGALTNASPTTAPGATVELALALGQTRNPADTVRALALLDPIARAPAPEQQPWQGLARLLVMRLAEQRRLEEQAERQAAQLRDAQRNVQQLNEKLEALKAIERSLNNRAVPAPNGASRP